MNKNDKKAVKAGFWYTVSSFVTKGSVLITTPLFSRLLSKEDLGVSSNISSWILVLLPLLTFDYYMSIQIARFDYKDDLDKYCSSVLVYGSTITLFFYVIAIIFTEFFCDMFEVNVIQLHIIFLYLLIHPALSIYQAKNLIFYRYKESTIVSLGGFFLSTIISFLFVSLFNDKATGYVLGERGTYILISLLLYLYLIKLGKGVSLKYLKYATTISFPLIWHSLSLYLLASSDRIIIRKFIGAEAVALYAIAYTSSHAISVLYHSLNNALSPWALVQLHEGNSEKHRNISRIYVMFFCIAMIGLLLIGPEILLIMGGKKYMEAVNVMPPALLAVVPQIVYSLYINAENYLKKQKFIAIGTMGAALVNLILNIIFVPKFGYVAAAYTTFAGYFCLFLFHFIIVRNHGVKKYYDYRINFIIVVTAALIIPAFTWLYGHPILRYSLLAVYFLVLVVGAIIFKDKLLLFIDVFFKKKKIENENISRE